jgi:hypothetical protein
MKASERLNQRLMLVLGGPLPATQALVEHLRTFEVPALSVGPEPDFDLKCPVGTRLRARWLKQLQPSMLLISEITEQHTRWLIAARLAGVRSALWWPVGRRRPLSARLAYLRLPHHGSLSADLEVMRLMRAEILGLGAGPERLAANPLGYSGSRDG